MTSLGGLHDRESTELGIVGTWVVDTIALADNPSPTNYDTDHQWICRLNWSYGSAGTLPVPNGYDEYVARLASYVRWSTGCHRWVVGNEPNLPREWPNGQSILPWQYADVYKVARGQIHAIPGHEHDEVLIAASGPWNADLKYNGNPNGDWIKYFEDVLAACGNEIDGFAIHTYTHGYDVGLVTSEARMQPPFQHRRYEFRTYRDYLQAIPVGFWSLPVYITEANGNGPWQAVGLMPAMLGEIDHWNKNSNHQIHAVVFYRYPRYDENAEFAIEGRANVITEYTEAIGRGYQSPPVMGASQVQEKIYAPFIPNQSTLAPMPALPPVEWDERLTARGVSVQTPPNIKPGEQFWRVVKARWYDEQESQGRHHIYVDAPDGSEFHVQWPSGGAVRDANGRSGFDAGNFPMSKSLNEFSVTMMGGIPSETLTGIGMGADGNSGIHTSTEVRFELVMMPTNDATHIPAIGTGAPPQPVQPVQPPVPFLVHPIADPARRVISQPFGVGGHRGIDYAIVSGTPIAAVDAGQVQESGFDAGGYGEYIKLRHAWGESLYAHLSRRKVEAGEHVNRGNVIGNSGSTGNSTGPHLHFAMRVYPYNRADGRDGFIDPLPYLEGTHRPTSKQVITAAIRAAALEFGVDADLLLSQAWAESSFNPYSVSEAGAQGLFQFMPATWAEWGPKMGAADPFNVADSARAGAAYMRWLIDTLKGNEYNAVVAYNAGIGNVINGATIPPITYEYADRVIFGQGLLKAVGA